jgi:hypothetical protein
VWFHLPNPVQDGSLAEPDRAGGAAGGAPAGPGRNRGDWQKEERFWQAVKDADFMVPLHGGKPQTGRWNRAVSKEPLGFDGAPPTQKPKQSVFDR